MTKNPIKTNSVCKKLLSIIIWVCFAVNPLILSAKGEIGFNRLSPLDGGQEKTQLGEILKHKKNEATGYSMKASFNPRTLRKSTEFISAFTKALGTIKNDKTLGFAGEELKGITTRQLTGAKFLYEKCAPGVVLLISNDLSSLGSGSVVNKQGGIVTNWHVAKDQETMMVWFHDPKISNIQDLDADSYAIADIIAVDPLKDLAFLQLRVKPFDEARKDLSPLTFGKDYQLSVAQDVFAIGHPESYIWSFTYGVISQLRDNYQWSYSETEDLKADVIQTQTPTNPGNSGGPLFNDKGEFIGINSFGSSGSDGLNFAIRLREVENFISEARRGKHKPEPIVEKSQDDDSEVVWDEYDRDENGVTDLVAADFDGDGIYDVYQIDDNEDGVLDAVLIDENGDNIPDTVITDDDGNGSFEAFLIDSDFDGEWDTEGIDTDGDMEPDQLFAYRGE